MQLDKYSFFIQSNLALLRYSVPKTIDIIECSVVLMVTERIHKPYSQHLSMVSLTVVDSY